MGHRPDGAPHRHPHRGIAGAPSKTDRERAIPVSANLIHVLAAVIRRHTPGGRIVPLVTRYDGGEKLHSPPMPFLSRDWWAPPARRSGTTSSPRCSHGACARLAERHQSFAKARFTPHEFRRIFATDLVNNGLPIHIAAALLGHLNLETTRGYVAVFEEDLVRHYQSFLDRRRSLRPSEEYRPATDAEWQGFQHDFDKRKVEFGGCGRPYGTPCVHEHACIRCPMLHVSPTMIGRLHELEVDLIAGRSRAHREGWLGEIEGLDLTLSHLRGKREQTRRLPAPPASSSCAGTCAQSPPPNHAQSPVGAAT